MNSGSNGFEEDWRELYENAPCGYLSSLLDGTIIGVNQTFLDWTGYRREDLLHGTKLQDLLTVPGKSFYETHYTPLLQMQGFVKEVPLDLICKLRDPLNVLVNSTRQSGSEEHPAFVRSIFFDATDRTRYERDLLSARRNLEEVVENRTNELKHEVLERQKAAESLKDLTSKLLKLRDDERRRIARDLHDSVGQLLTAVLMILDSMTREGHGFKHPTINSLSEAKGLVRDSLKEIRVVSYLLHPPLLEESGLESAIRWFLEGFSGRGDISAELMISDDFGRLPQDLEITIFRIVQECLTNVHRHSQSKSAVVKLTRMAEKVLVEVTDHGRGMPSEFTQGVGLRGMRERIGQFGGIMEIHSSSSGTTVSAAIPLPGVG
jgi:PAS domain S-box-containing protein